MSLRQIKREARAARIPWSHVWEFAKEIRQAKREAILPERELRYEAWMRYRPPYAEPWWRSGWRIIYRRAFEQGDRTLLRGFDVLADGLARDYPAFLGDDDPAEALWELLNSPFPYMPTIESCCEEALAVLIRRRKHRRSERRREALAPF